MSLNQALLPPLSVNEYDPGRAQALALRYASGDAQTGLSELHRADPDAYPSPLVVRRWRSLWPAFDALMREAEQARGLAMMEATLAIADDPRKLAASAKNAIAVRWRMAEALDPGTFASRRIMAGDPNAPLRIGAAVELTDAELLAIARGADPALLLTGPEPGTVDPPCPPVERDGGLRRGDEGGSIPTADSPLGMFHGKQTPGIGAAGVPRPHGSVDIPTPGMRTDRVSLRENFGNISDLSDAELGRLAGADAEDIG